MAAQGDEAATGECNCANCNATCLKPLRCGVCKAASYCTAQCQKEDWRFHKRICKKPPARAPSPNPLERAAMAKDAQQTLDSLDGGDPKVAEQVKQMMAGMGLGGEAEKQDNSGQQQEKPDLRETCKNCTQPCDKPLRCGVCKSATYCSAKCQREDWQFHKRNCKKPSDGAAATPQAAAMSAVATSLAKGEGPEAAAMAAKEAAASLKETPAEAPRRPIGSDREVVANEDVGEYYNHRKWQPQEEKKDFVPKKVDAPVDSKAPQSASSWNAAGTWEEKNMLPWWIEKLQRLKTIALDSFAGRLTVESLQEIAGEAQIVHIRGTPRFLFDLRLSLEFQCKFPRSSRAYSGQVSVPEFSNEVAASNKEFQVEVKANSDSDKRAAMTVLVPKLQEMLRECIAEYEAVVPKTAAFPGQLPPAKRAVCEVATSESASVAEQSLRTNTTNETS
eukprot:TRINITY_DN69912_c0_g1_i1.p1 TRINITY_DN69912_c0_g1~~TRINITY_DN69912_c0_g1_i1.p1  ORF type:complete len:460 (-),score=98.59 TRINITY_DN69912_c0_g1_i1:86-1426(-)